MPSAWFHTFALAVTLGLLAPVSSLAVEPGPPPPPLPRPAPALEERDLDALAADDPRRADVLVELALARHAEAGALEAEERRGHARALAAWQAAPAGSPPPALATPRADARRGEAVRLAERALDEAQALPDFPRAPEALLVAGLDADRIGRGREALRWLGRLVRRHPDSPLAPDGWAALGEHHLRDGDLTRARAALEVVARTDRPELRAWAEARLAEVALGATDPEGAVAALRRGLAAGSPEALATLDRLGAAPERFGASPGALLALAELLDASGAPGRALAARELAARSSPAAAARLRPELEGARRALAAAPLRVEAAARVEGATAPLRPSAAPGRADGAARLAAFRGDPAALGALARAALDEGRAGEARVLLDRALAAPGMAPRDEAALRDDRAAACWAQGDLAGARADLARALELDPALGAALENAGLVALAVGDPAEAEPLLAGAVAAEPARWRPRLLHARALAALSRPAEALGEAERALDLERGQPDALQLAVALRDAARAAQAGSEADPRLRSRSSL